MDTVYSIYQYVMAYCRYLAQLTAVAGSAHPVYVDYPGVATYQDGKGGWKRACR